MLEKFYAKIAPPEDFAEAAGPASTSAQEPLTALQASPAVTDSGLGRDALATPAAHKAPAPPADFVSLPDPAVRQRLVPTPLADKVRAETAPGPALWSVAKPRTSPQRATALLQGSLCSGRAGVHAESSVVIVDSGDEQQTASQAKRARPPQERAATLLCTWCGEEVPTATHPAHVAEVCVNAR
jgi:hypothetical protein